jgi:hypothetical protein
MAALTPTDVGGLLRKAYAESKAENMGYERYPFYAELEKKMRIGGEDYTIHAVPGTNPRVGPGFAASQSVTELPPAYKFVMTKGKYLYGHFDVEGAAFAACNDVKMKAKAIMPILAERTMSTQKSLVKLAALYAYRGGTGSLGQVATGSAINTTTVALGNPSDDKNFTRGQQLAATNGDGGALRTGGAALVTISAIPGNGTLTLSGNLNAGITDVAAGDYLVVSGTTAAGANIFPGLKSWCPFSTTKGTFLTVTRDDDAMALAGVFYDASTLSLSSADAVGRGLAALVANEGTATDIWCNPQDYVEIVESGHSAVIREQGGEMVHGFSGVWFQAEGVKCKLRQDKACPSGEVWITNMPAIHMAWVGDDIDFLDQDGNTLRATSVDSYAARMGGYPYGIAVQDPGKNLCGVKLR